MRRLAALVLLGCPGVAEAAPTLPSVSITTKTVAIKDQSTDFRPEGTSKGIFDVYEGQTFTVEVIVKNAATAATIGEALQLGYWIEAPYLDPTGYTIYTDWPKKDGKTWVVNDANSDPANPSHADPPASGKLKMNAFSPGETKKVAFKVKAAKYSIGAVDHPDVRAWIWHVKGYYGEQTSWTDKVETNKAGKELKAYSQHDVYSRTAWEWNATGPETEGWAIGNALSELAVDPAVHSLAMKQSGQDPYAFSPKTAIDAAKLKGVQMKVRHSAGPQAGQLFFVTADDAAFSESKSVTFATNGAGTFQDVGVDLSKNPLWKGTVTKLRLDPSTAGDGVFDVDFLRVVAKVSGTTGDGDGDGVVAAPAGADCDDASAAAYPGAAEVCNGKDDDCDGAVDDGFVLGEACTAGQGACAATGVTACGGCTAVAKPSGVEVCNGADDDCDGETDEGFGLGAPCTSEADGCVVTGVSVCSADGAAVVCSAEAKAPADEVCNGKDDDCDGQIDDGFGVGGPCTSGAGACATAGVLACAPDGGVACDAVAAAPVAEACNGVDDDCDGQIDDGWGLGEPCAEGVGACRAEGLTVCAMDGAGVACDAVPSLPHVDVCNGLDDDCNGEVDEGCECEPGEIGLCDLGDPDCPTGHRTCGDKGQFGECEPPAAGCAGEPGTDVGPGISVIGGGDESEPEPETTVAAGSAASNGCASAPAPAGATWFMLLLLIAVLRFRISAREARATPPAARPECRPLRPGPGTRRGG